MEKENLDKLSTRISDLFCLFAGGRGLLIHGLSYIVPGLSKCAANGRPCAARRNFPAGNVREKRQGTHTPAKSPQNRLCIHSSIIQDISGFFKLFGSYLSGFFGGRPRLASLMRSRVSGAYRAS
jgi:hypothetical protein